MLTSLLSIKSPKQCLMAVVSQQENEAISLSLSREVIYCYRNHDSNLETNTNIKGLATAIPYYIFGGTIT